MKRLLKISRGFSALRAFPFIFFLLSWGGCGGYAEPVRGPFYYYEGPGPYDEFGEEDEDGEEEEGEGEGEEEDEEGGG